MAVSTAVATVGPSKESRFPLAAASGALKPEMPLIALAAAVARVLGLSALLTWIAMFLAIEGLPEPRVTNSKVLEVLPNVTVNSCPARSAPVALGAMTKLRLPTVCQVWPALSEYCQKPPAVAWSAMVGTERPVTAMPNRAVAAAELIVIAL